jgi:PTH1 family peptidyl-tRNA hydrolase
LSANYLTVVGLGNPGPQYDLTRHNIGFAVVDALRASSGVTDLADLRGAVLHNASAALSGDLADSGWVGRTGFKEASCTVGNWSGTLIKPMTFMNRSGEPLQGFLNYKKIPISQVIVVHDEIDIPFGSVRVKADGGEGGHNGLRSISECCGGRGYARVRVGVGRPPEGSPLLREPDGVASWVLGKFSKEERLIAEELLARAVGAVIELARHGLRSAQNRFNR